MKERTISPHSSLLWRHQLSDQHTLTFLLPCLFYFSWFMFLKKIRTQHSFLLVQPTKAIGKVTQALQVNNRRGKKGCKQRVRCTCKDIKAKALAFLLQVTNIDHKQGTSQHGPQLHAHQVFIRHQTGRTVDTLKGRTAIRRDLHGLEERANGNLMPFNKDKRGVLCPGRKIPGSKRPLC